MDERKDNLSQRKSMHQCAAVGKRVKQIGNNKESIWCEQRDQGWWEMRLEAPFSKCVGFVGAVASTENQNSSADRKLVVSPLTPGPLFLRMVSSSYVQTLVQCLLLAVG